MAPFVLDLLRRPDAAVVAEIEQLAAEVTAADGHQALGDHTWLDLAQGGRAGFAGVVARDAPGGAPVGYAQVSRGNASWQLEVIVAPDARGRAGELAGALADAALAVIAEEGGGHVHWWALEAHRAFEPAARAVGLRPGRRLAQLRRALPLEPAVAGACAVAVRPFVVGRDEGAWLAVNNRAFASHPEQGGWDAATLAARQAQPWFDPEGFLLHEVDGRLAAFCWTKVHPPLAGRPALGEIYVIAVDPDFQGRGLGRALAVAGLTWLAGRGLRHAMLYVDADDPVAMGLYRSLGFGVNHLDRAFTGDVAPAGGRTPTAPVPPGDARSATPSGRAGDPAR